MRVLLDTLDAISELVFKMIFGEASEQPLETVDEIPSDKRNQQSPSLFTRDEVAKMFPPIGEYASRAIIRHKAVELYPNEKNPKHMKAREEYTEEHWEEVYPAVIETTINFWHRQTSCSRQSQ